MKKAEEEMGAKVDLLFNGDMHWMDHNDDITFRKLGDSIMRSEGRVFVGSLLL